MNSNSPLPAAILDHAVINVRDTLDAAQDAYRRLGFRLTPRGYHSLGSCNHLAVFGENYLELLGFPPGQGQRRPELLAHPLGLAGLAFRSFDAERHHRQLQTTAVGLTPPRHFSRPVSLGGSDRETDGEQGSEALRQASFTTFEASISPSLPGRVFFCQHHTPELVWHDDGQQHPNGSVDIRELIVVTPHPELTGAPFFQLCGQRPGADGKAPQLAAGAAKIVFSTPGELLLRTGFSDAQCDAQSGPARMAALVIQTTSLERCAQTLRQNDVPFARNAERQIVVAPEHCAGLVLLFTH